MRSSVIERRKLTRKRWKGVAALAMGWFCLTALPARAQAVQAWQGTLTIPTYKLGPADPNPSFALTNPRGVYPYTMLDNLTGDRAPQTYQALYLENRYLRIIVLPELGGHVYSIYDKVNRREVLYRNHVIKYGLVGPRGAWIAGGMEFSFPYAHTMDTVSPVESMIRHHPDGSASVMIGAIDWVSNMYWQIALTLRPDTARLQEDVTLFNATPQQHLYLFWTNTAVKATDDLQYIYPMREVISDDPFAPAQSWPTWDGIDHSWYKNVAGAMAIFGRAVHRDIFGIYYHQADYGLVHVADYRQDPGKKIWTWGTARSGRIWDKLLSDDDGPYNEIQSGRFYTQGYRELMRPRRVEQWTEYWYPLSGLNGGFVEATPQLALNVSYAADGADASVRLSPAATVAGATLRVRAGGKLLKEVRGVELRPLQTITYTVPVQDVEVAKRTLEVDVLSAAGEKMLHWSAAEPLDGNPDFVPSAGKPLQTEIPDSPQTPTQALFLRGLFLEKSGDLDGALKAYDEVLRRDPEYIPALLREGWHQYQAANFAEAERLAVRAEKRDESDPEVEYFAGVVDRAQGKLALAKDAFWTAIHYGGAEEPAFIELGEIEIRQGNYGKAAQFLRRAMELNQDDALAIADLSVAELLAGKREDAAAAAGEAVGKMPLLPYAVAQQFEDGGRDTEKSGAEEGWAVWDRIVESDPQNALAVAAWYHSLGAWRLADDVLKTAMKNPAAAALAPMVNYYLASDARGEGDEQAARRYAEEAASARTVAVFPNRLEDASVLAEVLQANPEDAQASYELGNFLFAHDRYDEAADSWQRASHAGFNSAVLWRNLGVCDWHVKHDLEQAAGDYARAIRLTPQEYRLYPDLDEIYEQEGNTQARAELFRSAPQSVLGHDTVQARYVIFLIEQKQYHAALQILAKRSFTPWEGGVAIHNLFVFANLQSGEQELTNRHPGEAEKYFRAAMQYPENLGTGRPPHPATAEQLYWLGLALEADNRHSEAQLAWTDAARQKENGAGACEVFPALALEKLGDLDQAKEELQRCIHDAQQPDAEAASLFAAGIAELHSHNGPQAREDFRRALVADPLDWQARVALSEAGNQP